MLVKSRYLSPKHKRIVDPVIHRNAYFAHPENLLLAMMTNHRQHIRELGLRRVMKARAAHHSRQTRRFKVPAKLNLDAVEYFDMIDWTVCPISEPLVLEAMTDAVTLGLRISSCKDGARHFHQMLVKSRYLSPKHKKIVDPVIYRNAYFAHPDNLLLAMMTDHRHTYESWAELHVTVDKYGGSRYVGDSNCHLPKISLPHTGCGKTRQGVDRRGDSCLWTEMASTVHSWILDS